MPITGIFRRSGSSFAYKVDGTQVNSKYGSHDFNRIIEVESFGEAGLETSLNITTAPIVCWYTSEQCAGVPAAALLKKVAVSPFTASITELGWDGNVELNEHFKYEIAEPCMRVETIDEACAVLNKSSPAKLRVTLVNGNLQLLEVQMSASNEPQIACLMNCVFALNRNVEYVPYRDNTLTKLLWSSISADPLKVEHFFFMDTNEGKDLSLLFSLSAQLFQRSVYFEQKSSKDYTHLAALSSGTTEIDTVKHELRSMLKELSSIYTNAYMKLKAEDSQRKRERDMNLARVAHSTARERRDQLSSLQKQLCLLEIELSILNHHNEVQKQAINLDRISENWPAKELARLQSKLDERRNEEAELRDSITLADQYDADEPFAGIIKQAEFNLRSMRMRVGDANPDTVTSAF